jgi:hypothetical protein
MLLAQQTAASFLFDFSTQIILKLQRRYKLQRCYQIYDDWSGTLIPKDLGPEAHMENSKMLNTKAPPACTCSA